MSKKKSFREKKGETDINQIPFLFLESKSGLSSSRCRFWDCIGVKNVFGQSEAVREWAID